MYTTHKYTFASYRFRFYVYYSYCYMIVNVKMYTRLGIMKPFSNPPNYKKKYFSQIAP